MGLFDKSKLILSVIFGLAYWFLFGQFSAMGQPIFGIFSGWAQVVAMVVFVYLFFVVYDKWIKPKV